MGSIFMVKPYNGKDICMLAEDTMEDYGKQYVEPRSMGQRAVLNTFILSCRVFGWKMLRRFGWKIF